MSIAQPAREDHAPLLERLFDRVPSERSYTIEGIEGRVPDWLAGTYYLNGPARFARGDVAYRHWLDGDGMVCSLAFEPGAGGRVTFTNRFVASHKLRDEEAAGRALYRTFGTTFPGDRLVRDLALASPVNVSVYPVSGRLLAFGEQGLPWELERGTLATIGEHTFGGRLNAISPFSAHPHVDRATGETFNFGVSFAARRPILHLYRFDAAGDLVYRRRHDLDLPRSVHDFGLAGRHAVVYLSPYLLDMEAFVAGGRTVLDCLSWQPEHGSKLLVARRDDGEAVATVDLGERYCLHLVNAFEDADGRLVVDVIELEEPVYPDYLGLPDLFVDVAPGRPVRRLIDLAAGRVVEERSLDYERACDFPSVHPASPQHAYDDFWLLGITATGRPGRKFFDELVHLRWSAGGVAGAWRAPAGIYLGGEPVVAADASDPGRAVVIVQELDAANDRAAFLLFDAFAVERGPVARLPLVESLPPLFHACFDPA
jgi:all-trans-8'-apo-beta-carotenal 15,15'-oxygenase